MATLPNSHYINGGEVTNLQIDSLTFPNFSPINAVNATGVFTITNTVADGETVTLNKDVYEFKTSGSATTGHIKVDISGGASASASATALISAITGNTNAIYTATTGGEGIVNITANTAGVIGNSIASTDTVANGSFAHATLTGGVDATVTENDGLQYEDDSYYYTCISINTTSGKNWRRIAKGSAY